LSSPTSPRVLFFRARRSLARPPLSFPTRRSSDLDHRIWVLDDDGSIESGKELVCYIAMMMWVIPIHPRWVIGWQLVDQLFAGLRSEEHRLNSSHVSISYAVFCLKKKNIPHTRTLD